MSTWQELLDKNADQHLQEYLDFLRIPSISALPQNSGDVQRAAEWVAERMTAAGIEGVQVMPTGGHPGVYGEWLHAPGKPTVLVYGHFDVQPVDPLDLWTTPPFEPTIRDGRVYARGATDDKGNMLVPILVDRSRCSRRRASCRLNVKFFFEGQEEIGSPQTAGICGAAETLLACDLVLNADGGQWSERSAGTLVGPAWHLWHLQIDMQGAATDCTPASMAAPSRTRCMPWPS